MLVLGVVLLICGYLLGIGLLQTIGTILVVVGAVLLVLEAVGHQLGGRRWY